MKKVAIIPAYEPDSKMLGVIENLTKNEFTVVVVNDGSDERFAEVFAEAKKKVFAVLKHSKNRGKGAALKTGLKFVGVELKEPYAVVTVDADGQHGIEDTVNVTNEAIAHPGSLVIGSRKLGRKAPIRSRSGNFITRTVVHITTPVKVYDTQSGLRAFTSGLVPYMCAIAGNRYEYEMNVLMNCAKDSIETREVKISAVYIGDNSSSHFDTVQDAKLIYRDIFKFASENRRKK